MQKKVGLSENFTEKVGDAIELESYGEKDEFDIVLLPNFLHHFDIETNIKVLKKACDCLKEKGKVVIVDMIPDDQRLHKKGAINFAGVMLSTTLKGDTYTYSQYNEMLLKAGFKSTPSYYDLSYGVAQTICIAKK